MVASGRASGAKLNMQISCGSSIPVRSRPGLTTTGSRAVDLKGAGRNETTVGLGRRGGKKVHRQRVTRKVRTICLRIGTLNFGTVVESWRT